MLRMATSFDLHKGTFWRTLKGPCSDYGSEGWGFESLRARQGSPAQNWALAILKVSHCAWSLRVIGLALVPFAGVLGIESPLVWCRPPHLEVSPPPKDPSGVAEGIRYWLRQADQAKLSPKGWCKRRVVTGVNLVSELAQSSGGSEGSDRSRMPNAYSPIR